MNFWVEFNNRKPGCISAKTKDGAMKIAEELAGPASVRRIDLLPYPASPQLNASVDGCPAFCHSPMQCRGRTACPQRYACSE